MTMPHIFAGGSLVVIHPLICGYSGVNLYTALLPLGGSIVVITSAAPNHSRN